MGKDHKENVLNVCKGDVVEAFATVAEEQPVNS
jgi:hypothetical protein